MHDFDYYYMNMMIFNVLMNSYYIRMIMIHLIFCMIYIPLMYLSLSYFKYIFNLSLSRRLIFDSIRSDIQSDAIRSDYYLT